MTTDDDADFYLAENSEGKIFLLRTVAERERDSNACSICLYNSQEEETDDEQEQNITRKTKEPVNRYCQLYCIVGCDTDAQSVCDHLYHTICLYDWFKSSQRLLCPLCKRGMSELVTQLPHLYSTGPKTIRLFNLLGNLIVYDSLDGEKHGSYREFYGGNDLYPKVFCKYRHDKLHGRCTRWFSRWNGNGINEVSHWSNGVQCGGYRLYNELGKLIIRSNYDDHGELDGLMCRYNGSRRNRLVERGKYRHGYRDGVWKRYYINKMLREVVCYETDMKHGKTIRFDHHGNLLEISSWKRGLLHGLSRRWYESSSQLHSWHYFQYGKLNGMAVTWHENGTVANLSFYDDDGKTAGPNISWNECGTIAKKLLYSSDVLHGRQMYYDGKQGMVMWYRHGIHHQDKDRKMKCEKKVRKKITSHNHKTNYVAE